MGQRKYEKEYKVQAVKLAREIGAGKAAEELGIPVDTLYGWQKAVREGRLDAVPGSHTPETAMSLAEEMEALRKQVKELEKANRRLKEENEFLMEVSALFHREPSEVNKAFTRSGVIGGDRGSIRDWRTTCGQSTKRTSATALWPLPNISGATPLAQSEEATFLAKEASTR